MWRLLALLLISAATASAAAPPRRIVSLNLCADQFLVKLADPDQIAGLTRLSHLPAMSPIAKTAARYPVVGSSAEALLAAAPDLVVIGWPGQADAARAAGLRARILVLPPANSYADVVAQTRQVASAVGHAARGEALVRDMDRALAAIPRPGRGRTAADYQRRGYLSGNGTLVNDMMQRVGLINLATSLHLPPLANLPLEQLVAHRPDFLIGTSGTMRDLGSAMQQHPAIAGTPRLAVPGPLLDCGGPTYPATVRLLAIQLARIR